MRRICGVMLHNHREEANSLELRPLPATTVNESRPSHDETNGEKCSMQDWYDVMQKMLIDCPGVGMRLILEQA